MEEVVWTVTDPSGEVTISKRIDKLPHITKIQIPKDVDEATKKFWVNYNLMQKALLDNGLMESK